MDKDTFEVAEFQHGGIKTVIAVEETSRLRRVLITRYRLMFGEPKKVGEVHIYVDEVQDYVAALQKASSVMTVIGEQGIEAARTLFGSASEEEEEEEEEAQS